MNSIINYTYSVVWNTSVGSWKDSPWIKRWRFLPRFQKLLRNDLGQMIPAVPGPTGPLSDILGRMWAEQKYLTLKT